MILDIFGGIDFSDKQKLFITGFMVLCCVLAVALFCAMFFTVKYLLRKSKERAIKDRLNTENITKAIRRKKRAIVFYITGFCVSLALFVLVFVLYMVLGIDIFDYSEWVIPVFCISAVALTLFLVAVVGGGTSSSPVPSAISNLKRQIKELNRLKETGRIESETNPVVNQILYPENSTNRKNKPRETFYMLFFGFAFMILIILLIFNFKWIIYGIYYTPLYALFGGSLYLPFYLHIVNICLVLLIIAFCFAVSLRGKENDKKSRIIGSAVFGLIFIVVGYFWGKDIYRDVVFIGKEKYLKTECRISSLHRRRTSRGMYTCEINGMEKVNGQRPTIEMNFYQYAELSKLKEAQDKINNSIEVRFYPHAEPADSIITVYYLPHTKRMLKYE